MKRFKTTIIAVGLTALALASTTALAGSGVGSTFNLGQTNSINATSTLTGATAAPQLTVKNTSADGTATALNLSVVSGRTPFKVNSAVKVSNLNADQLDGRDSTYFLAKTAKAADADKLDGIDSTGLWKLGGNAVGETGVIGTTSNQPLELKVNGARAFRLEPNPGGPGSGPNVIGGAADDVIYAGAYGSTIGGGLENNIHDHWGTVAGGVDNRAGDLDSDPMSAFSATVGGGGSNVAGAINATVAGGSNNYATGNGATIGGGTSNSGYGTGGTIAGGQQNNVSFGLLGAVGGGRENSAQGDYATVAGGRNNSASGAYSTVPGGYQNYAFTDYSFAAGRKAYVDDQGAFVWADSQDEQMSSRGADTFTVRAQGGIYLSQGSTGTIGAGRFIDTSTGGYLTTGGVWTDNSDRALKHDFRPLNKRSVLRTVARMPISSWSYKAEQPGIRHIGPMAQDFYKAFGLGLDDKHIGTIDEGGVALAAIQGLYRQNQALQRRVAKLERELARRLPRHQRNR